MTTAPYGTWPSPLGINQLTSAAQRRLAPKLDGHHLYWLQTHPEQAGRVSLLRRPVAGGPVAELTPAANVRTRAHEYGGGEYDVRDSVVVYSDLTDGRLHRLRPDQPVLAEPITLDPSLRYADVRVHPQLDLVLAVREDHRGAGEPINTIVALTLSGDNTDGGRVLCAGADFYSSPELSEDGRLAWVEWNHPNMPWDATALRAGRLTEHGVTDIVAVAGGPAESAVQPRWLPGGDLVLLSDRTNYWNPYRWDGDGLAPVVQTEAEFAEPQWVFGQTPYAVIDDQRLICTLNRAGEESVALLDLGTGELTAVTLAGTAAAALAASDGTGAALLTHLNRPDELSLLDLDSGRWTPVMQPEPLPLPAASIAIAQAVTWNSPDGPVHAWYYPPTNTDVSAPAEERPPLITLSHGGPTGFSPPSFDVAKQFWTSRGYAILDVNYGGSAGYGRAYRQRLAGRWGLVDVADCAAGAQAMVEAGRADPERLVVRGGSAGGYTTLRALTATEVFTAGISLYGVGDLEALATDTHKFESRYLDGLIGPYPAARDVYLDRSPIRHVDSLSAPILLLQGADDKVVPLNQAELMAAAARQKGLPVALVVYAGEGHGFRKAETIAASLAAQLSFLAQVFGYTPADDVPVLPVENLASSAN